MPDAGILAARRSRLEGKRALTEVSKKPVLSTDNSDILPLTPDDVDRLRPSWEARFTARDLRRIAARRPQVSVWNARTGEYLIGEPWRHRDEIVQVSELVGAASTHDLLMGFVELATRAGCDLAVVSEYAERRRPEFYEAAGFDLLEQIIIYELDRIDQVHIPAPKLRFERVDWRDTTRRGALIELDQRSFPWLWWNSADEFEDYCTSPGVSVEAAFDGDRAVAYVGITGLRSWGHLDRIAVDPELQGRGLGRDALNHAIGRLRREGVRRVALSTQARNHVSRALYESYGFRRTPRHDYRLFGRWLTEEVTHQGG